MEELFDRNHNLAYLPVTEEALGLDFERDIVWVVRGESGFIDGEFQVVVPVGRSAAAFVDGSPFSVGFGFGGGGGGGGDGDHDVDIHCGDQIHVFQVVGRDDRDFQRTVLHGWVWFSVGVG